MSWNGKNNNWFSHPLFNWMDGTESKPQPQLAERCNTVTLGRALNKLATLDLRAADCVFYPEGTYTEPGDEYPLLDNVPAFWRVRVLEPISINAVAVIKIYLPVNWNGRFLALAGAGMNTEFDWVLQQSNVISWPMGLRGGFACVVNEGGIGKEVKNFTWGFYKNGHTDWKWVHYYHFEACEHMIAVGKAVTEAMYDAKISKSYLAGCSGGGHQVICQVQRHPEMCDGYWADCPAIGFTQNIFNPLWAGLVFSNEGHDVSNIKFKAAYELAMTDDWRDLPYTPCGEGCKIDPRWQKYLDRLSGLETAAGPITDEDLRVMIKIWDGPRLADGSFIHYGFGPNIMQWPVKPTRPFGQLRRLEGEDGPVFIIPFFYQAIRWAANDANLDCADMTYADFENLYRKAIDAFRSVDDNDGDLTELCETSAKLIISHGTGDYMVPWQWIAAYYHKANRFANNPKDLMDHARFFLVPHAGHSFYDWGAPNVVIRDTMKALMDWVEKDIAPEVLPTTEYDFDNDRIVREDVVKVYTF